MTIPFSTLSQRHLVYAYLAVWILQFGYGTWVAINWFREKRSKKSSEASITRRLAVPRSPADDSSAA